MLGRVVVNSVQTRQLKVEGPDIFIGPTPTYRETKTSEIYNSKWWLWGTDQLHWLPVKFRILYKLCLFMHHVHYKSAPQYLSDSVQSVATASCNLRTGLRSADTANYVKRCTRTKFGERAFSFAGPATWNNLPKE